MKDIFELYRLIAVTDERLDYYKNINYIRNNDEGYVSSLILRGKKELDIIIA